MTSHGNLRGTETTFNKKSPRGIRPRRCSPPPRDVKCVTVSQDKSPSLCSEKHNEYLFGRAKTGGLGQVTTKKKKSRGKKMGITRPRPDGGVTNVSCEKRSHGNLGEIFGKMNYQVCFAMLQAM